MNNFVQQQEVMILGFNMLDLCSGIGGISLAAEWAGIKTVAHCDIEDFCQKVLKKTLAKYTIIFRYKINNKTIINGKGYRC